MEPADPAGGGSDIRGMGSDAHAPPSTRQASGIADDCTHGFRPPLLSQSKDLSCGSLGNGGNTHSRRKYPQSAPVIYRQQASTSVVSAEVVTGADTHACDRDPPKDCVNQLPLRSNSDTAIGTKRMSETKNAAVLRFVYSEAVENALLKHYSYVPTQKEERVEDVRPEKGSRRIPQDRTQKSQQAETVSDVDIPDLTAIYSEATSDMDAESPVGPAKKHLKVTNAKTTVSGSQKLQHASGHTYKGNSPTKSHRQSKGIVKSPALATSNVKKPSVAEKTTVNGDES